MHLSMLVPTFSLFLSANAFSLYDKEHHDPKSACNRALSAEIDCNKAVVDYLYGYYFSNSERREMDCTESCSKAIQTWFTTLSNECDHARVRSFERIWRGWNLSCGMDDETGRYWSEIIEEFPYPPVGEDLAPEYLCHPCYVDLLTTLNSKFGVNEPDMYYFENLVLARKACGKPITAQTSSLRTLGNVPRKKNRSSSAPVVGVEAIAISMALFTVAL